MQNLYFLDQLEMTFPGRKFTLDGHLVGSIGEVMAAYMYDLNLVPNSTGVHDATTMDGKLVQIKATQGSSVALRCEPSHLIVLKLSESGVPAEIFNGPGHIVWSNCSSLQKNGQKSIGLVKLRTLQKSVSNSYRIAPINSWPRHCQKLSFQAITFLRNDRW